MGMDCIYLELSYQSTVRVPLIQHAQHRAGPGEKLGFSVLLKDTLKWRQEAAAGAQTTDLPLIPDLLYVQYHRRVQLWNKLYVNLSP